MLTLSVIILVIMSSIYWVHNSSLDNWLDYLRFHFIMTAFCLIVSLIIGHPEQFFC